MPGACFDNSTSASYSPYARCWQASDATACLGEPDCMSRDWPNPYDPNSTGSGWEAFWEIRNSGRMVGTPQSVEYHDGRTCGELIAERPRTFGACCFERYYGYIPELGADCEPTPADECSQGWIANRYTASNEFGEYATCWWKLVLIERGQPTFDIPGVFRLPPSPPGQSSYKGNSVACRCTSTTPPYLPQDWIDAGVAQCLREVNDLRSWEEICNLDPPIDFQCQTIGFPVVIDDDGFAAFDAGLKRISREDFACKRVLADVFVTYAGFAKAVGCVRFDAYGVPVLVSVGEIAQPQCAAAYQDFRWDSEFNCTN